MVSYLLSIPGVSLDQPCYLQFHESHLWSNNALSNHKGKTIRRGPIFTMLKASDGQNYMSSFQETRTGASPIAQKKQSKFFFLLVFHVLCSMRGVICHNSIVSRVLLSWCQKTPASICAEKSLLLTLGFFCTIHYNPEALNSYGNNQNTNILSLIKSPALPKSARNYSMTGRVHFANVCTYFHVAESMGAFIKFSPVELKPTPCFPSCSITAATDYLFHWGWQGGPQQSLTQHLLGRKRLSAQAFSLPDHSVPSEQLLMMTAAVGRSLLVTGLWVVPPLLMANDNFPDPDNLAVLFLYANGDRLEREPASSSSVLTGGSGLHCEWISLAEVRPDICDCSCLYCLSWTVMLQCLLELRSVIALREVFVGIAHCFCCCF